MRAKFILVMIACLAFNAHSRSPETSAQALKDAIGDRPVLYTTWANGQRFMLNPVAPIPIDLSDASSNKELAVIELYVDSGAGRVLYVDVLQAPNFEVAKVLRNEVAKWAFLRADAKTADTALLMPVAFYVVPASLGAAHLVAVP